MFEIKRPRAVFQQGGGGGGGNDIVQGALNVAAPEIGAVTASLGQVGSSLDRYMQSLNEEAQGRLKEIQNRVGPASGQGLQSVYAASGLLIDNPNMMAMFNVSPELAAWLTTNVGDARTLGAQFADQSSDIMTASARAQSEGGQGGRSGSTWGLGLGALAGGVAAVALAPVTGGASIAIFALGAGAGAFAGTNVGNQIGSAVGHASGFSGGLADGDELTRERIQPGLELDVFANRLIALRDENPTLFQEFMKINHIAVLEQGVVDALSALPPSQEAISGAAEKFVRASMQYQATQAASKLGFNFTEQHFEALANLGPEEAKKTFAKWLGRDASSLTPEEMQSLDSMRAYGSLLGNSGTKYDWYQLYNTYSEARDSGSANPFSDMANQINSSKQAGLGGLFNRIFGRIQEALLNIDAPTPIETAVGTVVGTSRPLTTDQALESVDRLITRERDGVVDLTQLSPEARNAIRALAGQANANGRTVNLEDNNITTADLATLRAQAAVPAR